MSRLLKLIGIDGYHDIVIVNVMEIQTDQVWWVGCFDKVYIWTYSGGEKKKEEASTVLDFVYLEDIVAN